MTFNWAILSQKEKRKLRRLFCRWHFKTLYLAASRFAHRETTCSVSASEGRMRCERRKSGGVCRCGSARIRSSPVHLPPSSHSERASLSFFFHYYDVFPIKRSSIHVAPPWLPPQPGTGCPSCCSTSSNRDSSSTLSITCTVGDLRPCFLIFFYFQIKDIIASIWGCEGGELWPVAHTNWSPVVNWECAADSASTAALIYLHCSAQPPPISLPPPPPSLNSPWLSFSLPDCNLTRPSCVQHDSNKALAKRGW